MSIGNKIKELRIQNNLTQKDLADALNVTYQAVSRWEIEDVEPGYDTLKKMAKIFNCSMDELFEVAENKIEEPTVLDDENEETVEEGTNEVTEEKHGDVVLGICVDCNEPIYDKEKLVRTTVTHRHRHGRHHSTSTESIILCKECNEIREQKKKETEERIHREYCEGFKKKRIHSFIWSPLFALTIGLLLFFNKELQGDEYLAYKIIGTIGAFTFLGCLILGDNCIGEMFLNICAFSIKLPGLIFELDLDGIIWFITVKLGLFILSIIGSIIMFLIACVVSFVVSIFVYPFALARNIKCVEKYD